MLVTSLDDLREAVAVYTTRAAERLRRARLAANVVTVFISTDRFSIEPQYSNTITYELASATDTTEELLEWTLKGLERIYRQGFKYKKAGVMLNHLVPAEKLSRRMFGDMSFERSRRLAKAMDDINRRHGRDTIRFGVARADGSWKTRCLQRSARYTICLKEVLRVY
jgi:DNA polymerase V